MKRVVLAKRPEGFPTDENFRLEEVALPTPGEGEVLVALKYMSLDPYTVSYTHLDAADDTT
jgi:NADPH-dependent curcumin reductase CurA